MVHEFKQTRRVEFVDTDLCGIMHFSNYFRFMEATEHAFYRSLGLRIHPRPGDHEIGWPRVAATCAFTAPLRFDDKVEIQLIVRAKKEKSITYDFIFRKLEDGESAEVARGSMTAVSVQFGPGSQALKAVPLPAEFAEKIETAPGEA